ncbi:MAG TPA: agmatinase [Candidatus Mediterraneibacter cottocaccae]|nr:agmatinase [Candidatus Mediterraneibacter cottocaccae]
MKYVPQKKRRLGPACTGISTFLDLPYAKDAKILEEIDFAIAGVPFDTLVTFRPGCRFGPDAIRNAYGAQLYSDAFGLTLFDHIQGIDYGDIPVQCGFPEPSAENITNTVKEMAGAGIIPVLVGGDHSIAFPELLGYKEVIGKVAILHFDSHSDTGYHEMAPDAPRDHGTPFKDAIENDCILTDHSVQIGMRGLTGAVAKDYSFARGSGMTVITAEALHKMDIYTAAEKIRGILGDAPVFVSFDIDFLDPVYAPGTGTPEGGGFSTWEALELLRCCLIGKNFIGFDLVEVNPQYDSGDKTAIAGKRLIYEFLTLLACRKAGITSYEDFGI